MSNALLDAHYALDASHIADFRSEGFVRLEAVCPQPELARHREAITSHTRDFAKEMRPLAERDTYGKAFIQYTNLWTRHEDVRRFVLAPRFARIAAELMGVDAVRLYHDQALYKEPLGGHTPWHQDQQYWPLDGARCCTMWMPLVDCTAEMGTMRFAAGSQRLGYLGNIDISDESEERLEALIRSNGFPIVEAGDMRAGDATFHDGWTIHGAPGNASHDRTREVMTIIYVEDGAVITPPDHAARANDLASWFPGLAPGDKAASPLNPLLWSHGP